MSDMNVRDGYRGSSTSVEQASGEFQDENFTPKCKKYHPLPHKLKNLFLPRAIRTLFFCFRKNPLSILGPALRKKEKKGKLKSIPLKSVFVHLL